MMQHRRRLIPFLATVLVVQSLVAVLPHVHGSPVGGHAWKGPLSIDAAHHCLSCAVHAPVVEPAAEFGHGLGATITSQVSVECESKDCVTVRSSACPRGPPRIV